MFMTKRKGNAAFNFPHLDFYYRKRFFFYLKTSQMQIYETNLVMMQIANVLFKAESKRIVDINFR